MKCFLPVVNSLRTGVKFHFEFIKKLFFNLGIKDESNDSSNLKKSLSIFFAAKEISLSTRIFRICKKHYLVLHYSSPVKIGIISPLGRGET